MVGISLLATLLTDTYASYAVVLLNIIYIYSCGRFMLRNKVLLTDINFLLYIKLFYQSIQNETLNMVIVLLEYIDFSINFITTHPNTSYYAGTYYVCIWLPTVIMLKIMPAYS